MNRPEQLLCRVRSGIGRPLSRQRRDGTGAAESWPNVGGSTRTPKLIRSCAETLRADSDRMQKARTGETYRPPDNTAQGATALLHHRQLGHRQRQPLDAVARKVDLGACVVAAALDRQHAAFAELVVEHRHAGTNGRAAG